MRRFRTRSAPRALRHHTAFPLAGRWRRRRRLVGGLGRHAPGGIRRQGHASVADQPGTPLPVPSRLARSRASSASPVSHSSSHLPASSRCATSVTSASSADRLAGNVSTEPQGRQSAEQSDTPLCQRPAPRLRPSPAPRLRLGPVPRLRPDRASCPRPPSLLPNAPASRPTSPSCLLLFLPRASAPILPAATVLRPGRGGQARPSRAGAVRAAALPTPGRRGARTPPAAASAATPPAPTPAPPASPGGCPAPVPGLRRRPPRQHLQVHRSIRSHQQRRSVAGQRPGELRRGPPRPVAVVDDDGEHGRHAALGANRAALAQGGLHLVEVVAHPPRHVRVVAGWNSSSTRR